jgi:glycosyltransferase involved in cell wall biosynthesis
LPSSSRLRVALVVPGFSASENDWAIPSLLDLVRRLAQCHDLEVFALRYPPRRGTYEVFGATVNALAAGRMAGARRALILGQALAWILRRARRGRFDLVHGLWADEPGFVATTAARALGVPALVSLMGGELVGFPEIGYGGQLSRANRLLLRLATRSAARVSVGSSFLLDIASRRIPMQRLSVLPLGVDTDLFAPAGIGNATPILSGDRPLLHVASLSAIKDQATLLHAFRIVVDAIPGVHLHIVGEGPCRSALVGMSHRLDLASRMTLHGAVGHDKLPDYYRSAELLIMSSRHESFGMSVLEAGACGRSTIGTAVGVLPELQPATRSVPVGNASALADAIAETLLTPGCTADLGRRCLALVMSRYTLDQSVAAHTRLYEDLINGPS